MESLFSKLKFGAGGQLSAINYGSGVACIQARTGVDRVTAAVKGIEMTLSLQKPLQSCLEVK